MKQIQEAIEKFKGKWWKYSLSPTSQLTEWESELLHLLSLVAEKQRDKCKKRIETKIGRYTSAVAELEKTPLITETLNKDKP